MYTNVVCLFVCLFVCFLSLVCSPAPVCSLSLFYFGCGLFVFSHWFALPPLFALSHFTPFPTPHHHSTTMTTVRSKKSYADVTLPSDSLTVVPRRQVRDRWFYEPVPSVGTAEVSAAVRSTPFTGTGSLEPTLSPGSVLNGSSDVTGGSFSAASLDTTDTLTVTSDSSPVRKTKSKKQKRNCLDSASDSDETSSSKFPRSRANSEDSQLVDAEVGTSSIPRNRLFVGGIPLHIRQQKIHEIFSKFGKVKHVQLLQTKYNTSKVLLNSLLSPTFHRFVLCR